MKPLSMSLAVLLLMFCLSLGAQSPFDLTHADWTKLVQAALTPDPKNPAGGFVALGWSKAGNFAAIELLDSGQAAPLVFLRVIIFDAVEDQLLFDRTLQWDPDAASNGAETLVNASDFRAFIASMDGNGIHVTPGSLPRLEVFPWLWHGVRYQAAVQKKLIDSDGDGFSPKINWSLSINAEKAGKTASKRITGQDDALATDVGFSGLYKSTFENRIIVLINVSHRGVEGDTSVETRLSGCALDKRLSPK